MASDKKELAVAALRNGTVIDHIPADALFKVVRILGLENTSNLVTIGNNLPGSRMGTKGIIKIADVVYKQDVINRIAVIAPTAVINIIEDYDVVSKSQVSLPDEVIDIVRCNNPKCITCNEPMKTRFEIVSAHPVVLKCRYCEHEVSGEAITIK